MHIPQFIFVEGADNVGKSTLVKNIMFEGLRDDCFLKFPTEKALELVEENEKELREKGIKEGERGYMFYKLKTALILTEDIIRTIVSTIVNNKDDRKVYVCDRSLLSTFFYNLYYLESKNSYLGDGNFIDAFEEEMNDMDPLSCICTGIQSNIVNFVMNPIDTFMHYGSSLISSKEGELLLEDYSNAYYNASILRETFEAISRLCINAHHCNINKGDDYKDLRLFSFYILNNNSGNILVNDENRNVEEDSYRGKIDSDTEYQRFVNACYKMLSRCVKNTEFQPIHVFYPVVSFKAIDIFKKDGSRKTTDEMIKEILEGSRNWEVNNE